MGIIGWLRGFLPEPQTEAPSPSTYTQDFDWQRKVVILSVAPNSYKEWVFMEDLYQAFRDRLKGEV